MSLPKYAFFKGRIVPYRDAHIGVLTHGLNYGTAAFGGLRGYWNVQEKELFVFRPEGQLGLKGFPILLLLMFSGYLGVILAPMVRTSFSVIGTVFRF